VGPFHTRALLQPAPDSDRPADPSGLCVVRLADVPHKESPMASRTHVAGHRRPRRPHDIPCGGFAAHGCATFVCCAHLMTKWLTNGATLSHDSRLMICSRVDTPHLAGIAYAAPTGPRIVPTNPRPSGASIVASPEFRSDYTTLFRKHWLDGGTDGRSSSETGYPDHPPPHLLRSRHAKL
jgi:hypothetical protein